MTTDERQLLISIAQKVASMEASLTAIYSMLQHDLRPTGEYEAELRKFGAEQLLSSLIEAQANNFEVQFPEFFRMFLEFAVQSEASKAEAFDDNDRKIAEGGISVPEAILKALQRKRNLNQSEGSYDGEGEN